VGKQTAANLSVLPAAAVYAIEVVLKEGRGGARGDALARAWARRRGACRRGDAGVARVAGPASVDRLAGAAPAPEVVDVGLVGDTTLGGDLEVADASRHEVYAAMDWQASRQDASEAAVAGRHLAEDGMAMFDDLVLGRRPLLRTGHVRPFPRRV
jgi:hypothetical protein